MCGPDMLPVPVLGMLLMVVFPSAFLVSVQFAQALSLRLFLRTRWMTTAAGADVSAVVIQLFEDEGDGWISCPDDPLEGIVFRDGSGDGVVPGLTRQMDMMVPAGTAGPGRPDWGRPRIGAGGVVQGL